MDMKSKKIFSLVLILALILAGCGMSAAGGAAAATAASSVDTSDMFSKRDLSVEYDESESVLIRLNGDSASCSSDAVEISGSTVTITDEGTYILSGTLTDGMIIVDADESDKPRLVLNGVSITSAVSAALCVVEADKVFVTLAEGSENTLANGGAFTEDGNNVDGAVFSKQDLTFNGSGSLSISSPAGHGIVCKDDLVFTGGEYTISSASHGIDANDSVRATGSSFVIESGKDGIHAENKDDESLGFVYIADGTFDIEAEGDGISAGAYMQIDDGDFDIVTGGGSVNATRQTSDTWGSFGGRGGAMGGKPNGAVNGEMNETMEVPNGAMGGEKRDATGEPDAAMGDRQQRGGQTMQVPTGENPPTATGSEMSPQENPPTATGSEMSPQENPTAETTDAEEESTGTKGLKAAGNLIINGGTFTIDSADDGVHSNASIAINGGTFELKSGDDGFHADETLTVSDGTINITDSYEGMEGLYVCILGGDISIKSTDDGLNAAGGTDQSGLGGQRGNEQFGGGKSSTSGGSITISGGSLYVNASGDGLDANGSLEISGGAIIVSGPTTGDTSVLDYDTSGVISGGTFIGTGAAQMLQSFSSSSEQGVITSNAGNLSAGTKITLTDSSGKLIISREADQSFNIVILSSPDIVKGETYTLTVGINSEKVTAN